MTGSFDEKLRAELHKCIGYIDKMAKYHPCTRMVETKKRGGMVRCPECRQKHSAAWAARKQTEAVANR